MSDDLESGLTDFERARLKKLQRQVAIYLKRQELHERAGLQIASFRNKVYSEFEKFWTAVHERESEINC